jgi:hypothetical protein
MFESIVSEITKGAETVVQLMQIEGNEVKIIARRKGQQIPSIGDLVKVEMLVCLPCEKDGSRFINKIVSNLQYGTRAQICGEFMWEDWGTPSGEYRVNSCFAEASTWKSAVEKLATNIESDITNLLSEIEIRKQALRDAENAK